MNINQTVSSSVPTPESIWAILQETAKLQAENEQKRKENERILKEGFAEIRQMQKDFEQEKQKIWKEIGYLGRSQGSFAEEYFFNAFERGQQNFFGKKFDDIERNLKTRSKEQNEESDIILYNADTVAIIEVKFKVRQDHIAKLFKKAETFKILNPDYKDFKIYLGLASMIFPKNIERECLKKGIAVIKQVGEKVVIIDEGLKAY